MSEVTPETPAEIPERMSVSEAARILAGARKPEVVQNDAQHVAPEPPLEGSEARADDSQTETSQAEAKEDEPEAQEAPAIDPPRSWSKDEKERFRSLPPETQAYLAERENDRDRALTNAQREAAEKLKGLTAKEQAVEQARQQYESALPQLLQTLQAQQAGEFSDIKTIADVEKLAREDWPRYLQWDVSQKKLAAVQQEMLSANQRQQQEKVEKFSKFAQEQDALFSEKVPDMGDSAKAEKLQKAAVRVLKDLGFAESELADSWNGQKDFSLRDHRVQLLIRDASLYREGQQASQQAAKDLANKKAPPPKVQRPGTAQPVNAAQNARLKDLSETLPRLSGNAAISAAAELMMARGRRA